MYYPEQRLVARLMHLKRQVRLPEEAVGSLQVDTGHRVDVRDVVARGLIPAKHVIIDAQTELGLKTPEELEGLLLVRARTRVPAGEPLAGRDKERGKRILAPFEGLLIGIDKGRILFQAMPEIVNLEAGVRGRVTQIQAGRGVEIEATAGIVQGVWGNGRNVIATLRTEPERGGILSLPRETLDTTYRGEIIVTRNALTKEVLGLAEARNFAGIIAPSMSSNLVQLARQAPFAIMLTIGFGDYPMTAKVYNLLQEFVDSQAALNASEPRRFDVRRPEAVFSRVVSEQLPVTPDFVPIEVGTEVRVGSDPYLGRVGIVKALPKHSIDLANGLRVRGAKVDLGAGLIVDIPLANLELAGT